MFEWFKEAVIADYKRKKNEPSFGIVKPTPALLRDEFRRLLSTRRNADDIKVLRRFLEMNDDENDLERRLGECDIDKFKPLQNYMKGETQNPGENIVKLLAWLIDFHPRPYVFGMTREQLGLESDNEPGHQTGDMNLNATVFESPRPGTETSPEISKKSDKTNKTLIKSLRSTHINVPIMVLLALILMITGYYAINRNSAQYMTWNGFKYQMVNKDEVKPGVLNFIIDDGQLNQQQWISCADSISRKHIGKIWYIRNNNLVELFTSDGYYPPEPKRKLHILTDRIYNNFIVPGKVKEDCEHSRPGK